MGNQKNNQDIRIVRGSDRYAGAPDTDLSIQIPIENSKKSIIEGDRTVLLNLEERFDHERQISTKFRIAGKIVNLFDNTIYLIQHKYSLIQGVLYQTPYGQDTHPMMNLIFFVQQVYRII